MQEHKRVLKLVAKLTRRMKGMESAIKTIKFSKAFDNLMKWARSNLPHETVKKQREVNSDLSDTDSDCI